MKHPNDDTLKSWLRAAGQHRLSWHRHFDIDENAFHGHLTEIERQHPRLSTDEKRARAAYRCLTHVARPESHRAGMLLALVVLAALFLLAGARLVYPQTLTPTLPAVSTAAPPTFVEGQRVPLSTDLNGNLRTGGGGGGAGGAVQLQDGSGNPITSTGSALDVNVKTPSPFSVNIGNTPAVTQSGAWTMQPGNTANTTPWLIKLMDAAGNARAVNVNSSNQLSISLDGSSVTQPVSGTVTANAGTGSFTVVQPTASSLKVDLSGTSANATAIKVDGSGVTQPVSAASLPLPSGAATSAKQPAIGVAGTPSTDVITVQGTSGGYLPTDVEGDYDTGPAVQHITMFGVAIPAAGGAVTGGSPIYPFNVALVDPAGSALTSTAQALDVNVKTYGDGGTASGTLGALNATVTLGLSGLPGATAEINTTTLSGIIIAETSADGGDSWTPAYFVSPASGVHASTLTNPSALSYGINWGGTITNVRVRVSVYTSGSIQITLRAVANHNAVLMTAHAVVGNGITALSSTASGLQVDGSAVTQPTNLSKVNGTTTDTNAGTASAGTQRFVLATDQPQLTNALKVDGSAVTQPVSGTGTFATQDAATGSTGSAVPTKAIYVGQNENGNTRGTIQCDKTAQATISSATTTSLVAVSGSTTVYVCSYVIEIQGVATTAGTMQLEGGTGAACVTTQSVITPTFIGSTTAGTPTVISMSPGMGYLFKTAASSALCAVTTTSTSQKVFVTYGQF